MLNLLNVLHKTTKIFNFVSTSLTRMSVNRCTVQLSYTETRTNIMFTYVYMYMYTQYTQYVYTSFVVVFVFVLGVGGGECVCVFNSYICILHLRQYSWFQRCNKATTYGIFKNLVSLWMILLLMHIFFSFFI